MTAMPPLIADLDGAATRHETSCGPDARMVWRRWGTGAPLILLHGGAGSWMHWARNIGPLAQDYAVWVPDMPGFGDSDLPAGAGDADGLAPHVLRGTLEVSRGQAFRLCGFSFGALVAAVMAAEAPPTLQQLTLVSVNGMGLLGGGPPPLKRLRGVGDPAEREAIVRHNLAVVMLHDIAKVDDVAVAAQNHGVSCERLKGRSLVMTDILFELATRWRCPVDAVWGRWDSAYRDQIDRLSDASDRLGLRHRVIMAGAAHWLQYECADDFNPLLAQWLAE